MAARRKFRFRPMSFSDIIDEAFDLYKSNFVLLVGIGAVFYVPLQFLGGMISTSMAGAFRTSATTNTVDWARIGMLGVPGVALCVLYVVAYAAVTGAFTYAISQRYLEERTSIAASYRFIRRRVWRILLALLVSMVAVTAPMTIGIFVVALAAGLASQSVSSFPVWATVIGVLVGAVVAIAGIVFSVGLAFRLPFVTTALVLEGLRPVAAMKRSWALANGHVGRVFGILFVTSLVVAIIASIITGPVQYIVAMFLKDSIVGTAVQSGVSAIASALLEPITAIVLVLLYYDLRIRKEGFDLQMLARDLAAGSGETVTGAASQPAPAAEEKCGHCGYAIYDWGERTSCPSCQGVYHSACWAERGGCSNPACTPVAQSSE